MAIPLEDKVFYPESDGEPMAESEDHLEEVVYAWQALKERFEAEADVFIGANLFLYYTQGDPNDVVAPDGFVVKGVPKLRGGRRRRKYLLWEEKQVPCFVLEATSESTRAKDEQKKGIYEALGIEEYFQFDPQGEYLKPQLQGHRLMGGRYRPVRPRPDGSLVSRTTGVAFHAEGPRLRLIDAATGAPLLRKEEEKKARLLAEEKADAEARARHQAEQARQQAEETAATEARARHRAEQARQQAEETAATEAKARHRAEQARQQAEEKADAEARARHQAEEKARALEEELARLRRANEPSL